VYRGKYDGKTELYTKISPLPDSKKKHDDPFMQITSEEDNDGYIIDDAEDISPEEDIGMAETVNIDEEPITDQEDDDPLHPRRNVPEVPVSNDSGTMF